MKKWSPQLLLTATLSISLLLAGCGNKADQQAVAQYKGNTVTQAQFYKALKAEPNAKTTLANLLIYGAMKKAYGSAIDESQVTSAYKSYQTRYGSQFNAYLRDNNYTKQTFKQMLRLNFLSEAALKAQMKPTTAQLKAAWGSYQPKITVQHILTTSQTTAETVIIKLQAGGDFAALASEYSVDAATSSTGGKLSAFDNTDKNLDSSFKTAAYKLKTGAFTTTPVKTTDGYEVIKMLNHPAKGTFAANKANLTQQLYAKWAANSTVMKNVISEVLKEQNVKIKDKQLASALNAYKGSTTSATDATK